MNEDEYLADRLDDQITWYSNKSKNNKKWFQYLKSLEMTAAAIIPFLAGIGAELPYYALFIGLLGVIIAVSVGMSAMCKFHENWIEYRTTAENLKHEKYLYKTKCFPYDKERGLCDLVQRVESLISKENSQWSQCSEKK